MTSEEVLFSIIIPTFNRAELIYACVKSIVDQRNVKFEIIIVDDGSTDNTSYIVAQLKDDRVNYIKTPNRERGAARNAGLRIANGLYVNYFDSDDILNPCLFHLSKFIVENKYPDVIYGLIENVSGTGDSIEVINPSSSNFKSSILYNNFLACGSVFIKRSLALKHVFSEDRRLSGTEDWELWLRVYAEKDFTPTPIIIFKQRQHDLRSLRDTSFSRVVEREKSFIAHINTHRTALLAKFSKGEIDLLIADRFTLMALSLVEFNLKVKALKSLIKSFMSSVLVVKRKRFWATLKKIILN